MSTKTRLFTAGFLLGLLPFLVGGSCSNQLSSELAGAQEGSITVLVTIEGDPAEGVILTRGDDYGFTVAATGANGRHTFTAFVYPGSHTVTISGYPPGVVFPEVTLSVTVNGGQNAQVEFAGTWAPVIQPQPQQQPPAQNPQQPQFPGSE